jgi:hypothetical protein
MRQLGIRRSRDHDRLWIAGVNRNRDEIVLKKSLIGTAPGLTSIEALMVAPFWICEAIACRDIEPIGRLQVHDQHVRIVRTTIDAIFPSCPAVQSLYQCAGLDGAKDATSWSDFKALVRLLISLWTSPGTVAHQESCLFPVAVSAPAVHPAGFRFEPSRLPSCSFAPGRYYVALPAYFFDRGQHSLGRR